jgi:two-component system, NtrC family, nitrogen regulation response regulator NtrX
MPRKPVVLVVEDQSELGRVIRGVLSDEGYEVVAARDAGTALGVLRDQQVNLLISDLSTAVAPEGDPLAPLIEEFPDLRVIVIGDESDDAPPFFGPWRVTGSRLTMRRPFRLDDLVAASREVMA